MNKIWTILNKGRAADTSYAYARKTELKGFNVPVEVRQTVASIVVDTPVTARYYRIERLIQAVINSPYAKEIRAADPFNTYDYSLDVPPKVIIGNPTDLQITPMLGENNNTPSDIYNITLKVPAEAIGVESSAGYHEHPLNMTNGLSDIIALSPSLSVRFQGDVSAQVNGSQITIQDTTAPEFDLPAIMANVRVEEWYDAQYLAVFTMGTVVERLAAVILNMAKGVADA